MERKKRSTETVTIKFAPRQKLPPGYRVEWWESDEHYHWVNDRDRHSDVFADRFQAYRAAWTHYNEKYEYCDWDEEAEYV